MKRHDKRFFEVEFIFVTSNLVAQGRKMWEAEHASGKTKLHIWMYIWMHIWMYIYTDMDVYMDAYMDVY